MDAAFFAANSLRFFGDTAPVVAVPRGAVLPSFGRVLACRCFLPSRFFSVSLRCHGRRLPRLGAISIIGTCAASTLCFRPEVAANPSLIASAKRLFTDLLHSAVPPSDYAPSAKALGSATAKKRRLSSNHSECPPPPHSPRRTILAAEQKLPSLYDFFHPGGLLAKSSLNFEHRPGQYKPWPKTIEQCFNDQRHLIVEAGTGTGKTLAYLLPALRRAREQKQRIIISTGTKNLQEQLFFKDIPFLESILGPLRVCYMKGRANYLCKQKLYALRDNPILQRPRRDRPVPLTSCSGRKPPRPATAPRSTTSPSTPRSGISSTPAPKSASARPAPTGSLLHHRHASQSARVGHRHRQPPPLLRRPQHQAASRRSARRRHPARSRLRHLRRSARARRRRQPILRHRPLQRPLRRARPRHRIHAPRQRRQHLAIESATQHHPRALQALLRLAPGRPIAPRPPRIHRPRGLPGSTRRRLSRRHNALQAASKASSNASAKSKKPPASASAPPTSATT
jgi:hypothetical protein